MGWGVHIRAKEGHIPKVLHIEEMPVPDRVVIPVSQHIGAPAKPIVKTGDEVKEGQLIAESSGFVSSNIHSSVFGKVTAIEKHQTPSGKKQDCIIIETDERNFEEKENKSDCKPEKLPSSKDNLKAIESAGIVGMGGAMFPSHVKLKPPKKIHTLILNGCECEPYLSSDAALMYHESTDIIKGANIMMELLQAKKTIIAIEDDKKESITTMKEAAEKEKHIEVRVVQTKYPQGAEKTLIKEITGKETPSGSLPMETGCVVHNVGTAKAVSDAVNLRMPLTQRILTVSGPSIKTRILRVKVGTLFSDILAFCEVDDASTAKIVSGGPMMGVAQYTADVPVIKGTSGILVFTKKEMMPGNNRGDNRSNSEKPCIRCAQCIDHCPASLMPNMLAKKSKNNIYDKNSLDCVECGVCSFVCPSNIPLVSWIRLAKSEIAKENAKQNKK